MRRLFVVAFICAALWMVDHPQSTAANGADSRAILAASACSIPLAPGDYTREVPGWPNRNYLLHVPTTYACSKPAPVVMVLHGGGSRKEAMRMLTCPDGRADNPECMDRLADREGFLVVYPDGTENFLWRTFNAANAGDGTGGWSPTSGYACVSGYACRNNVDDIAYFNALLDDLEALVNVDADRVFATGISNGAAMAHRLACGMADRIAAIASVAGGNQYSVFQPCSPSRPVPVVEFHGTQDTAWPYGTDSDDRVLSNGEGIAISVPHTVDGWARRNGCASRPISDLLPNRDAGDGSFVSRDRYLGCRQGADVVLYRIFGGGHMWPDGFQWDTLVSGSYGPTNRDINGNQVMWDFFEAHPIP